MDKAMTRITRKKSTTHNNLIVCMKRIWGFLLEFPMCNTFSSPWWTRYREYYKVARKLKFIFLVTVHYPVQQGK